MNDHDTNRLNMIDAVFKLFLPVSPLSIAAIPGIIGNLNAKKAQVNSLSQVAEGTTSGVTVDTKLLRKTMQDKALKCANAVIAYASATSNNTLKALVNYSESDLNKMKKEVVDDTCEAIHDAAVANIAALGTYGLFAADNITLQTAIDAYRASIANPRNAVITKAQANRQAKGLIDGMIANELEQLDALIYTVRLTNPTFYNTYKLAREIIDLGSTTAKVRGTVKNDMDVPIANVLLKVIPVAGQAGLTTLQGITDAKGKFNISHIHAGNYDFSWEIAGYITVAESNVHIAAGKELKRKIVMQTV